MAQGDIPAINCDDRFWGESRRTADIVMKPESDPNPTRTNKPIAQLAIHDLAQTRRVPSPKPFDIKWAWFNENEYWEFFPRTLLVRQRWREAKRNVALRQVLGMRESS
jgi:hypothetical protein